MSESPRQPEEKKTFKERRRDTQMQFQKLPRGTRIAYYFCLFFTAFTLSGQLSAWLSDSTSKWPLWLPVALGIIVSAVVTFGEERRAKKTP